MSGVRVLIGPKEVAGITHGLTQGFSEHGVFAEVVLSFSCIRSLAPKSRVSH